MNEWLEKVKAANVDAARFTLAFLAFCHMIDDLVDRDVERTPANVALVLANYHLELLGNPWFNANRHAYWPLMNQAFMAWADSERLQKCAEVHARHTADVIKGFYHEVAYMTVFLVLGPQEAAKVERSYDFEDKQEGGKQ